MPIFWYVLADKAQLHGFLQQTTRCRKNRIPLYLHYTQVFGAHNYTRHKWLTESQVWIDRCQACKSVRIHRGNNVIFLDIDRKITRILMQPHPIYGSIGRPPKRGQTLNINQPQLAEFQNNKTTRRLIKKALKEANLKVHGIRRLLK